MRSAKKRNHNEWFRTVSLGNRKSCPECHEKLEPGESVWSWGEYIRAKWHTVKYFCRKCFDKEVKSVLLNHAGDCGCEITLCGRGESLPDWLTLDEIVPAVVPVFAIIACAMEDKLPASLKEANKQYDRE